MSMVYLARRPMGVHHQNTNARRSHPADRAPEPLIEIGLQEF